MTFSDFKEIVEFLINVYGLIRMIISDIKKEK